MDFLFLLSFEDMLSVVPTLWVGTSFGSILTLVVSMPEREVRKSQPVLVTINGMFCCYVIIIIIIAIVFYYCNLWHFRLKIIGGPVLRLKGAITSMSFLDAFGSIIPFSSEPWRDDSRDAKKERKYCIFLRVWKILIKNTQTIFYISRWYKVYQVILQHATNPIEKRPPPCELYIPKLDRSLQGWEHKLRIHSKFGLKSWLKKNKKNHLYGDLYT